MRSALNHIDNIYRYDLRYRAEPMASYPNQLATLGEIATLVACQVQLVQWLADLGPIPSR